MGAALAVLSALPALKLQASPEGYPFEVEWLATGGLPFADVQHIVGTTFVAIMRMVQEQQVLPFAFQAFESRPHVSALPTEKFPEAAFLFPAAST